MWLLSIGTLVAALYFAGSCVSSSVPIQSPVVLRCPVPRASSFVSIFLVASACERNSVVVFGFCSTVHCIQMGQGEQKRPHKRGDVLTSAAKGIVKDANTAISAVIGSCAGSGDGKSK